MNSYKWNVLSISDLFWILIGWEQRIKKSRKGDLPSARHNWRHAVNSFASQHRPTTRKRDMTESTNPFYIESIL